MRVWWFRGQGAGSKVMAPKTSGGGRTSVRHTIPLGIVIFLVCFVFSFRNMDSKCKMLHPWFLKTICWRYDAAELVRVFNKANRNLSEVDLAFACLLFVSVATEHNHTELVTLLLIDKRLNLNLSVPKCFINPTPLFVAVQTGNLALVEVFLLAGASIAAANNNISYLEGISIDNGSTTILEYACFLEHPTEMLKLLLSYDRKHCR